jgi:RNA polymerase sigma factor (sigma-70 family)
MSGTRIEADRHLERLFGVGAVGGLSDAELLERFAAADDKAAGAAFEVIVARHGPMVQRVCRRVLRDAHAADDAFQATFLVLARRAGTLGDRELLGNWLYGVAMRTSRKARLAATRRIARDRVAAGRRSETIDDPAPDEPGVLERGRILHEEIGRLPGSYRAAVVACYLEGLTHAQAAIQLRLAESTVRGRLARARKLLGHRLARRGVAPAAGLLALEAVAEAGSPGSTLATAVRLPEVFVRSVARDALRFARSAGPATRGAVPSTAVALADGVLSIMWLSSLKTVTLAAALTVVGLGLADGAAGALGRPAAEAEVALAGAPTPDPATVAPRSQESGEGRTSSSGKARKAGPTVSVDRDLARLAPGPIVRTVPANKDTMILSYLPKQTVGHVDNFGLSNNGVRVLIDWPTIPAEEAAVPDRRFVVAIYSRKTTSHPPAGRICAFEILDEWPEWSSWDRKPSYHPDPAATYPFEPGDGWKLFDITPLVREQAKAGRHAHGVLLRFLNEDVNGPNWSGYELVSREGAGEWAGRHPLLLIVKDQKKAE